MRVLVVGLLLVGFGLLRVASVSGASVWAFVAAGVSVAAVAALVADWRRKAAGEAREQPTEEDAAIDSAVAAESSRTVESESAVAQDGAAQDDEAQGGETQDREAADGEAGDDRSRDGESERAPGWRRSMAGTSDATVVFARVEADGADAGGGVTPPRGPEPEHATEQTPSTVTGLDDQVLVVDEQPHYHRSGCRALDGRETIALAVHEAVRLEFVPCEVCTRSELSLVPSSPGERSAPPPAS